MEPVTEPLVQADQADPLIALLTIVLTAAARRWAVPDHLRPALPGVACAIAVGLRAVVDALTGEPLTGETVLQGLGAGAVAVLTYSQGKGLLNGMKSRAPDEDGSG